ncbi:uncharacterized protein MELLADRAFT_86520 [Melampsora larici-populina 98AG31]|uniref:Uncharacterized protein n=1 Tax=Melampsora larici-populina (strain 98AG31 / pathotype 3-4-7) TaxID=747676 RepID=F4SDQ1_MELLP|nr:uncharacterized protein MELLADRAFT_86520 [Melampsora larici-populina 98AG31]EGF97225.1 hypothetical protein MELLADRAFT_86520 [Melampsora larici-populina 98AG31]
MAFHLKTKSHGSTSGAKHRPNNHKKPSFLSSSSNQRSNLFPVFQLATLIRFSKDNRMGNRNPSHVPLPADGRIDTVTQHINGQRYPGFQGQRASHTVTPKVPPLVLASSDPFNLPPPIIPPANYSPLPARSISLGRPVHDPTARLFPSKTPLCFNRGPTPFTPSTCSQGTSSGSSINPHINPFILNASQTSQHTPSATDSTSNHNYSSPLKRHAPTDGPSVIAIGTDDDLPLDLFNDTCGAVPTAPIPATPRTDHEEDEVPDKEQTFQIYFNLYQPECPDQPEPKKSKRTPGGSRNNSAVTKSTKLKYKNFNPKLPNQLTLRPKEISFTSFRHQMFDTCNEDLPGVSEVLECTWVA